MVLAVIGIGLGLVVPVIGDGLFGAGADGQVRRLLAMVGQAREQAMLDGKIWTISMDVGPVEDDPEGPMRVERELVFRPKGETRVIGVHWLSTGQDQTSGRASITFRPNGLVDPVLIHVGPSEGEGKTVMVRAFNPRPRVENGYIRPSVPDAG